ncbi:retrovirus-related pol polyprotein from transposon TNT 1-94 [Tanacetum coccineum]|uniref:Retrovirus-related pol polyprotein from transposon TNT 1-94 n=1 Tax=Tanacetum coccineum TaxID=301880 RepID=A0ABQ4WCN7_9ASTR
MNFAPLSLADSFPQLFSIAFYMEWSKDEDAVIFVVVVVYKAEDEEEDEEVNEKMSTKKMRSNGLHIEKVVGAAFNLEKGVSPKYNAIIVEDMVIMAINVLAQDKWKKKLILWSLMLEQPKDKYANGKNVKVLRLKKGLNGLKQAPRVEFERTDIGLMSYYLGTEVDQTDEGIFICQERYAKEVGNGYSLKGKNEAKTDKTEHGIGKSAKNQSRRYKYLIGPTRTIDYGMFHSTNEGFKLVGYSDSDWAGNKDYKRSTSGFLFFLGNNAFTWSSKKQPIVTVSSCEAEYVAAISCVCHTIWLRSMLKELQME